MTIHDQRLTEFLKRVPHGASARVSDDVATAFKIVSNAREKIAAIRADTKLSRDGQNAAISKALAGGPLPHMKQLRSGVDRDLGSIKSEREGMRKRVVEATTFSQAEKTEVRQWLRSLTKAQSRPYDEG